MTGLLDTNVALYLLGGRLAESVPSGSYGVSVITEMELLACAVANHGRRAKSPRFPQSIDYL